MLTKSSLILEIMDKLKASMEKVKVISKQSEILSSMGGKKGMEELGVILNQKG